VSTTLDAAGRAASVAGKADAGAAQSSYASSISYAAHGGIAGLTTGDMVTRTVTYNTRLQMTQVQQGSLMTLGFTYDATANNGNMTGAQITRGAFGATQTFTYDAVNRLKTAAEGAVWNQTYVYDAAGNRALTGNSTMANPGWTPQSPDGVSVPFNAKNQWTAVGGYDLAGNTTTLTQTGTSPLVRQTMTYDAEARMTTWSSTSPVGSAAFTYDGDGRRVTKVSAGLTTTYVYDPAGNLAASYGGAAPPAAATGTLYVTQDHLGSTRLITKAGVAVGCHDYVPFGEEITWGRTAGCYGAADTEVRFTGQVHDSETKLEYFGARYYGGAMGRFTSADEPLVDQDPGNPQSWNLYGYVRNNPLSLIDPTGRSCETVTHPDGSSNQSDNGDGKGCAGAQVAPTKSGSAPTDTSDIKPQETGVKAMPGSLADYFFVSFIGGVGGPQIGQDPKRPFNPSIAVYVAPGSKLPQARLPKPSLAACLVAPHDFVQTAYGGRQSPSDALVGNNNQVPNMHTDIVARKASSPKGTKQSVGNAGQFSAQFNSLAVNTLANTIADCALRY
jgi:RHS repeat-associated protein